MAKTRGRRGLKRLIISIPTLIILCPGLFLGAMFFGVQRVGDKLGDLETVPQGSTYNVTSTGDTLRLLVRGDGQGWAFSASSDSSDADAYFFTPSECVVTGPTGAPVSLTPTAGFSSSEGGASGVWYERWELRPQQTGEHRIDCGADVKVATDDEVGSLETAVITSMLVAIILPLIVGVVAFILMVWGVVLLVTSGKKKHGAGPYGPGPGGPGRYAGPSHPTGYQTGPGPQQGYRPPGDGFQPPHH